MRPRSRYIWFRFEVVSAVLVGLWLIGGGAAGHAEPLDRCPPPGDAATAAFPCFSEVDFAPEVSPEDRTRTLEAAGVDLLESRLERDGALVVVRAPQVLEALAETPNLTLLRHSRELRCDRPGPGRGNCDLLVFLNDSRIEVTSEGPGGVMGLKGRRGDDTFINNGELVVHAESMDAPGPDRESAAAATGISAGAGDDFVVNRGTIRVTASASQAPDPGTSGLARMAAGGGGAPGTPADQVLEAGETSEASAVGIQGARGNDDVRTRGTLEVSATANTTSGGLDVALLGLDLDASGRAQAEATGIDVGVGDDRVLNQGGLDVDATASAERHAVEFKLLGASAVGAQLAAESVATGIDGGLGAREPLGLRHGDELVNDGSATVSALAKASSSQVSFSLVELAPGSPDPPVDDSLDARILSQALAVGIHGKAQNDSARNSGSLDVSATATTTMSTLGASVDGRGVDASGHARAGALGFDVGVGDDEAHNQGVLGVSSTARAERLSGEFTMLGASALEAQLSAASTATGIDGGEAARLPPGHVQGDVLQSSGDATISAVAEASSTQIALNLVDSLPGSIAESGVDATATASGILGRGGQESIDVAGQLCVDALAEANAVQVELNGLDLAIASTSTSSEAISLGVDGGEGEDAIVASGLIEVAATSDADVTEVNVTVIDVTVVPEVEGKSGSAATDSHATSTGLRGGAGEDLIESRASLTTTATADTDATSVAVSAEGVPSGLGGVTSLFLEEPIFDASITSMAETTAIEGNDGSDWLANAGSLNASSTSSASQTHVGVSFPLFDLLGIDLVLPTPALAATSAATQTAAAAAGLEGGDGQDTIANSGDVVVDSEATARSTSVAVAGEIGAVALGGTVADASSQASAMSTGLAGGGGDDQIVNTAAGSVAADAVTDVIATSVDVGITAAPSGLAIEAGFANGASDGSAQAQGISGGQGDDWVENAGSVAATTLADVDSIGVSVSGSGAGTGVAVAAALVNATTTADADSAAIATGDGRDRIRNTGKLDAAAVADVDADSVSVGVALAGEGLAISGAAADASAVGQADATGIRAGSDRDHVWNEGNVSVDSQALVRSLGVAVGVQGAGAVTLGAALTRANTEAIATSTGIELDEEADDEVASQADDRRPHPRGEDPWEPAEVLNNLGEIDASATADATSTSVGVEIGFTVAGLSGGAALADSGTLAEATATGLAGGERQDLIRNQARVGAVSSAEADGASVAVNLQASLEGAALGASVTNATTDAVATSTAIDAGAADDRIVNEADLTSTATADAEAASYSFNVGIAFVPGGAALGDSSATATSTATGIVDGDGDDWISSSGTTVADSTATASGTTVAVNVVGASIGDSSISADATATGIAGGEGREVIGHTGDMTATSTATATGPNVSVSLVGASLADATNTAGAQSTGIGGGVGEDAILNAGTISTVANATAKATTVSVTLVGAGLANPLDDAKTEATATASGLAGGEHDDRLVNTGSIDASSTAITNDVEVGVSLVGAAVGDLSSQTTARSLGMEGNGGQDVLLNDGILGAHAVADSDATSVEVSLAGAALGDNAIGSEAEATGMAGGTEGDRMLNRGAIAASAVADTGSEGVAVDLIGDAEADANIDAVATAVGMDGGEDGDQLRNEGSIHAVASSNAPVSSVSVNLVGAALGDVTTLADAHAIGMAGGSGHDDLENLSEIAIEALATSGGSNASFVLGGAGEAEGNLGAEARSSGMEGGSGRDRLRNRGTIDVDATTALAFEGDSTTLFGTAGGSGLSGAETGAVGIDGGAEQDLILSEGALVVASSAVLSLDNSSFDFGGTGAVDGELSATTRSVGILGGGGSDWIRGAGSIHVSAASSLTSKANSDTAFGTSEASGTSGAFTEATGIEGGAEGDWVGNLAELDVSASGSLTLDSSSYTFGGTGEDTSALTASTQARGISGGTGTDRIVNAGEVAVQGSTTLDILSDVEVTFGQADGGAPTTADAMVTGIAGGEGADAIRNLGTVDVTSSTFVNADKTAYVFGGVAGADVTLDGSSQATGISGGTESSSIYNEGVLDVTAASSLDSMGGAKVTFGGSDSAGSARSEAKATGIGVSDDADRVLSSGRVEVLASSDAAGTNDADGGWLVGDGDTRAEVTSPAAAVGIDLGEGANRARNEGELVVTAEAAAAAFAYAAGAHLSWDGDGEAVAKAEAEALAVGIRAGNGRNAIWNAGVVDVSAHAATRRTVTLVVRYWSEVEDPSEEDELEAIDTFSEDELPTLPDPDYTVGKQIFWEKDPRSGEEGYVPVWENVEGEWVEVDGFILEQVIVLEDTPTLAFSNGNGITGTGSSTAEGFGTAKAVGVLAGDGPSMIVNEGTITVTASPDASIHVDADGDAFGDAIGNALADSRAIAVGILIGDGDNRILNGGTIRVSALPKAQASGRVTGGDICIWFFGWWCGGGGEGVGTAKALYEADAVGIQAGDGENHIVNDGEILVLAAPEAGADASGSFTAKMSGDSSPVIATGVQSRAVGIETGTGDAGDGNNLVINRGLIEVEARELPIPGGCANSSECSSTVEAIGIRTGDGNDEIQNLGGITTTRIIAGQAVPGVAIDSGGGDDVVLLADASTTTGTVDLGPGNDILHLVGTPGLTGSAIGREGTDTVLLDGAGAFASPLEGFEVARKRRAGTYALQALPTMQRLQLDAGTLRVEGDYAMSPTSSFEARVEPDGTNGRLDVAGSATLAGALTVAKGEGYYVDGTEFHLVTAGLLDGSFSSEELPQPTPLLSFEIGQDEQSLTVTTSVQSFSSISELDGSLANYLDSLSETSSAELSLMLGDLQEIPSTSLLSSALSELGPRGYDDLSQATARSVYRYVGATRERMELVRASRSGRSLLGTLSPAFARSRIATGARFVPGAAGPEMETWVAGLDRGPDLRQLGNRFGLETGGIALGVDQQFGRRLFTGIGLAAVEAEGGLDSGATDSLLASAYATYLVGKRGHLAVVVTGGETESWNARSISLGGGTPAAAWSEHGGRVFSALVEAGHAFSLGSWRSELFGSLHRFALEEDAFVERGVRGMNLAVEPRRSEIWTTELGLRLARSIGLAGGRLMPRLELAWLSDFDRSESLTARFEGAPGGSAEFDGSRGHRHGGRLRTALGYERKLSKRAAFGAALMLEAEERLGERDVEGTVQLQLRF